MFTYGVTVLQHSESNKNRIKIIGNNLTEQLSCHTGLVKQNPHLKGHWISLYKMHRALINGNQRNTLVFDFSLTSKDSSVHLLRSECVQNQTCLHLHYITTFCWPYNFHLNQLAAFLAGI